MNLKSNQKLWMLIVGLLVIGGSAYWTRSVINAPADPLKEQGLMYERLSLLSPEELSKLPKQTGIDLAMLQDFKRTKDLKLGYVPVEKKVEAFQVAIQKFAQQKANRSPIEGVNWQERGPNNLGGRTRALMFDPNDATHKMVWAAGISGGLWYTNDITTNGQWYAVDNFMSNLAVSCIAYDPSNTQIFYMGTGEGWFNGGAVRGAGIWKTTDGGINWFPLSATFNNSNFYFVQKIVVLADGSVLAATHSGVYKTSNGGDSWSAVLANGKRAADIELASDGTIYATMGIFEAGTLHKSANNGTTWSDITPTANGQRIEVAVAPSNPQVIYAVASAANNSPLNNVAWFRKSINGGTSWSTVPIPKMVDGSGNDFTRAQAWYDLILAVYPNDPNKVIVGGIDLHLTTDAGSTWTGISHWYGGFDKPYVHADQHAITFKPGSNNEVAFGNDGGVFYSANMDVSAPSFLHAVNGYNVTQFYACAMGNDGGNTFLAGAQDNGSHLFKNAGLDTTTEVTGGDGAYCFINQMNADIMITSYVFNNYYISSNGGDSFFNVPGNDDNIGEFINPAELDSRNNILYACAGSNQIRRVTNIGVAGTSSSLVNVALTGGAAYALTVSPYTENRLFIGTSTGKIFVLDNAHQTPTVTQISTGLGGGSISSIDVGSSDNRLLATVSNYGSISVYESTNGGLNWVNKEGNLPDMPVRWGIYNPNNNSEVLLATEVGVWSTTNIGDASPVWEPTIEGLANVRCDMLKYRASDGQVAIATYGRGLFTTDVFEPNVTPIASFTANATVGYTQKAIQFNDASLNANESWSWTFGDGGTSTVQNPQHAYSEPGFYEVKLVISNGASEKLKSNYIQILPSKSYNYGLTDGGNFESNSTDFGVRHIGGTSFQRGKSTINKKSGTTSGEFAWVTGITETTYSDWSTSYLYTPNFLISQNETNLKFKTKFSFEPDWDGFIVEYSLNKGETWAKLGSEVSATNWYNTTAINEGTNLNVVFTPGEAIFSKTTNNAFQNKSFNISSFAGQEVAFRFSFKADPNTTDAGMVIDDFEIEAINADFSTEKSIGYVGKAISFVDESISPNNSWLWTFGDEGTSTSQNPSHTYTTPGIYNVKISVDNGTSALTKVITILPTLESLSLEDGGDLEGTELLFAAESVSGTPFLLGKKASLGTSSGENTWVTSLTDLYDNNSESVLYFPNFNLSANSSESYLSFKMRAMVEAGKDGAYIEYSTDGGDSWDKLGNEISANWYSHSNTGVFGTNEPIFSGVSSKFVKMYYNLSEFDGTESLTFRLIFKSDNATNNNGIAIDDIELTDKAGIVNSAPNLSGSAFTVYPNPTKSSATFKMENDLRGLVRINVVDTQGKVIMQLTTIKTDKDLSLQINLENQPEGIYFIKATAGENIFFNKIIKE